MSSNPTRQLSPLQNGLLLAFESYRNEVATYGFAISQFSKIEFELLFLFNQLDEREAAESTAGYWNIGSVGGRVDWIDSRIKAYRGKEEISAIWPHLRVKLREAIQTRNDLAHGEFAPIMFSDETRVGFWSRLAKSSTTGRLAADLTSEATDGLKFFSPEKLIDHALKFIELSEALYSIATLLKKG